MDKPLKLYVVGAGFAVIVADLGVIANGVYEARHQKAISILQEKMQALMSKCEEEKKQSAPWAKTWYIDCSNPRRLIKDENRAALLAEMCKRGLLAPEEKAQSSSHHSRPYLGSGTLFFAASVN
jgi:hypothetical protein